MDRNPGNRTDDINVERPIATANGFLALAIAVALWAYAGWRIVAGVGARELSPTAIVLVALLFLAGALLLAGLYTLRPVFPLRP